MSRLEEMTAGLQGPVAAAWQQVVKEIISKTGVMTSVAAGPSMVNDDGGRGQKCACTWFLSTGPGGRLVNHNLSLIQFGRGPAVTSWLIRAGRHLGATTHVEVRVKIAPDVELLRHVAGWIGLLQRESDDAGDELGDLDAVRQLAINAREHGETIDPGAILDVLGYPADDGPAVPPLMVYNPEPQRAAPVVEKYMIDPLTDASDLLARRGLPPLI